MWSFEPWEGRGSGSISWAWSMQPSPELVWGQSCSAMASVGNLPVSTFLRAVLSGSALFPEAGRKRTPESSPSSLYFMP